MNDVLKQLGYGEDDRVVIFHADDIGMCQSTLTAYEQLLGFGLLSSASTMVPCSWFPSVAQLCRQRTDYDMGAHITLTSEWDVYRWGGITGLTASSNLIDDEGYFYRTVDSARNSADLEASRTEIIAQIERAISAGIELTHIDNHMGVMMSGRLLSLYLEMGLKYRLPIMLPRSSREGMRQYGMDEASIDATFDLYQQLESHRIAIFDNLQMMPLREVHDDPVAQVIAELEKVPAGLTYFIIHPSEDTPELRAIAPDWQARVRDLRAFTSPKLREYVENSGIHVIGYRVLRDHMRG